MNNKDFKVPDDKQLHFQTIPEMGEFYDELYKKGIGFKNEKNLHRKTNGQYMHFDPSKFRKVREEHEPKHGTG